MDPEPQPEDTLELPRHVLDGQNPILGATFARHARSTSLRAG